MEIQKFTIRRTTPDTGSTWTLPCSGGTNFYPINLSTNCSGITMYNSTGSQVMDTLDSNIMSSFPNELKDCSMTDPCVILWDLPLSPNPTNCFNPDGYNYVMFKGLVLTSGGTFYQGSYNDLITIYDVTNTNINQSLSSQGINAFWGENVGICTCLDPLDSVLYRLPITLTQDFNDIGHYSVWDGKIDQQQVFSNFVYTANTTGNGMKIQVYNTTDFGSYKQFQSSPYTISWGECDCSIPLNANGYPCCEDLTYPSLTSEYEYVNPAQYNIRVTHNGPWGITSVSHLITVPNLTYNQILAQPYSPAPPTGAGMGGSLSPSTPGGNPYQVNLSGPNPYPTVFLPPLFTSTAYHGTYGTIGTPNYYPLDSGTHISQYSGTSFSWPCFELTGITDSSVGIFSTYSNLPSTTAPGFLPNGFELFVSLPVGGDVVDPITNTITAGMVGELFAANAQYTGYTISSANGQTPIDFYDFTNGVTIFVSTSCGLNSLAFGGEDCFECPEESCEFCLTKDEYIDRVTLQYEPITANAPAIPPNWSPFVDYVKGDIVYDVSPQDCCCYIAVTDIIQTSTTGGNSPFAGDMPSQLYQGVWMNPTGTDVHVWEGCSPDCVSCPPGSALPCQDPYNPFNAYPTMGPPGPAGTWANGQTFSTGEFIFGQDGNCYRAITSVPSGIPPSAITNNMYWDYIGCASWVCPQDLTNIGVDVCELISGSTPDSFTFYAGMGGCLTAYNDGECPVDDRWHCANQYGCDMPGCQEIDYTHPEYNNAGYPFSVTFSSMTDCEKWCNPIAFSCTTPTGTPCCSEISCALTNNADYYTIMTTYVLTTPTLTALNNQLFLDPFYTLSNCELGVPTQGIDACCDFTQWHYFCDQGCVEINGGNYATELECETAPGNNGGLTGPCGWDCYDYWLQPCTAGPGPNTCVPCYVGPTCGQYNTSGDCCTFCTPPLTECWVCLSGDATPCQNIGPCPTPLPAWESDWYTNPALVPLSGYGANPNFSNATYPNGSYLTAILCNDNCTTSGGTDCLVNMIDGSSWGNCINYANPASIPTNWAWSPGGPYDSYSACCENTGCCNIECDEDNPMFNPTSSQYDPSWPYWPCVYEYTNVTIPCNPLGPVYCTFTECVTDNPTGCDDGEPTCDCACDPLTGGIGDDQGEWSSTYNLYDQYDYVSWQLGTTDVCCYYCDVLMFSNPYMGPPPGFYDCNYFVPGGPDAANGTPNSWMSCGSTPSGTTTGGCDPCQQSGDDTYSCDYINGCVLNIIPCPYVFGSEAALNCYTASTCQDHCKSGCYCDDNGTPSNTTDDYTSCVMLQDVINGITPWTSTWYGFISLWQCQQAILAPPPGSLDCCTPILSKWHCDDSDWCNSLSPGIPGTDGLGCIEVFNGDPLYLIAAYTDQASCITACKWVCDVSSTAGVCQFVGTNPLGVFPEHSSAYDCWQNTANCNCTGPNLWFCDTNPGQSGVTVTSNCFPETAIQTWQTVPPYVGWTDNLVYGQGGTSVPYSTGTALGFASQSDCHQACRFCCDDVVSCTCDLTPYNFNCSISINDCINAQSNYPCCPIITEWCCDETLGCVSFVGTMPVGCVHGPFTSPGDCQDECNFVCGECIPDLGASAQPDPCHCTLITVPFYTASPPYTDCVAYNDLVTCETNQYPLGGTGSNSTSCCPCQDCQTAGSVTFPVIDGSGIWSLWTTVITLPIVGSVINAPTWANNVNYISGDTVINCGSSNFCCCYVLTYDQYDYTLHGILDPEEWYNAYANQLAASVPNTYPGGASNGGYPMWVPCDTGCPTTASTAMFECLPGQPIYTQCTNATMVLPVGPIPNNPGITVTTSSWQFCQIFSAWIVDTYPSNTLYHSKKTVSPNGINAACPNPTNYYGGIGAVYMVGVVCSSLNTIYNAANGCPTSQSQHTCWNDTIGFLNAVNANLSLPQTFSTSMTHAQAEAEMVIYGNSGGGLWCSTSPCACQQSGPCYCQPCTSGPTCVYPTLTGPTGCNAAAAATPCCDPPVIGYFVCDTANPNTSTGICPCIWDATALVGYNSMSDCTGDTATCCYEPPSMLWDCVSAYTGTSLSCGPDYLSYVNTCDTTVCLGYNSCIAGNVGFTNGVDPLKQIICTYGINQDVSLVNWQHEYHDCQLVPTGNNPVTHPDCCGPDNRKLAMIPGFYHIFVNGGMTYYTWKDFMDALQIWGLPGNGVNGIHYGTGPSAPGYENGYTLFAFPLPTFTITFYIDYWYIANVDPTAVADPSNLKANYQLCRCQDMSGCTCTQDVTATQYASEILCEQGVNCCNPIVTPSWDCTYAPLWNCYDPGTGMGLFSTVGACQTACVPVIVEECEECDTTLAPYLSIGANYTGMFSNSINYQIDDCVYDPSDNDCCYCCVLYSILPPIAATNNSTTRLQNLLFNVTQPPTCKDGQGYPSAIVGLNVSGGMWLPCDYDRTGQACSPPQEPCDSCDISLAGFVPVPVTFPYNPWSLIGGGTFISFYQGECIYDVDPIGNGDSCCWCCACPEGIDQNGNCNPIPAIAPGSNQRTANPAVSPTINSSNFNPPPCWIDNMVAGDDDPNTGTFGVTTSWNTTWMPCGTDSTGNQCGGLNSSSSSSIA